ncbi:MAG: DUF4435 domain-containing protein [Methylocystis sp.]
MTDLPRWTVSELLARYDLEPELADVYVEGLFDKEVITECYRAKDQSHVVYEISNVDIPHALLAENGFTDGAKQRVIVLARRFASLSNPVKVRCVVDRDLDHWFGELEKLSRLLWTEHCSLELYFFSESNLQRILVTLAKVRIEDWTAFVESLVKTLRILYAFRLADRQLGLSLSWLPQGRCLKKRGSEVSIDRDEYVDRLLDKNGRRNCRKEFLDAFETWLKKLHGDPRSYIHGHDFIELVAWSIRNFGGLKDFTTASPLQRILILQVAYNDELYRFLG